MLDLKYYLEKTLDKKEDRDLISKYFNKIKFKNIYDLIYFFKNINEKCSFVREDRIKAKLETVASKMIPKLEAFKLDYTTFLNNEVFPNADYFNILADLNPKHSSANILLECPCCSSQEKKRYKKDNRDAFIIKVGSTQTGVIKCNRSNNCGESTSVVSHIMSRDGLNFKEAVSKLAKSVGIDLNQYEKSLEVHIGEGANTIDCEKEAFQVKIKPRENRNSMGIYDIDFKKANTQKSFIQREVDYSKYDSYYLEKIPAQKLEKLKESYSLERIEKDLLQKRLQIIYSYIKDFTMQEKDREEMVGYFANRGIAKELLSDVGCLKASKITQLVKELKENFDEKDLVDFGILDEKYKAWRYGLVYTSVEDYGKLKKMTSEEIISYFEKKNVPKDYLLKSPYIKTKAITKLIDVLKEDFKEKFLFENGIIKEKFTQNDSAVFFMHNIYNDSPTNLEFKFYGNLVKYSKRKAVSMANSQIVDSNYYGDSNNINFIKKEENKIVWWTEGAVDSKTLENFKINSNALIGVQKHFDRNLGYYSNKINVIAFDEDNAGHKEELKFAKKLKLAGVEHVFISKWDSSCGKDLNDLLINKNFDEINIFPTKLQKNEEDEDEVVLITEDIQKIPQEIIDYGYKKANLESIENTPKKKEEEPNSFIANQEEENYNITSMNN